MSLVEKLHGAAESLAGQIAERQRSEHPYAGIITSGRSAFIAAELLKRYLPASIDLPMRALGDDFQYKERLEHDIEQDLRRQLERDWPSYQEDTLHPHLYVDDHLATGRKVRMMDRFFALAGVRDVDFAVLSANPEVAGDYTSLRSGSDDAVLNQAFTQFVKSAEETRAAREYDPPFEGYVSFLWELASLETKAKGFPSLTWRPLLYAAFQSNMEPLDSLFFSHTRV